jgi:hypothetical protein
MARITLSTHWKFQRLARAVGSKVMARGVLETLWEPCWMIGDPYVGTSQDIEALCEWKGEKGALTKALLMADAKNAGFIEPYVGNVRIQGDPHYQIHDFFHHCPEYVRRRRDQEQMVTDPKTCEMCHADYFARSPNSKYCSQRCRQKSYRGFNLDETAIPQDTGKTTDSPGVPNGRVTVPTVTDRNALLSHSVTARDSTRDSSVTDRDSSVTVGTVTNVTNRSASVTVERDGLLSQTFSGSENSGPNSIERDSTLRRVTVRDRPLQYSRTRTHTLTRTHTHSEEDGESSEAQSRSEPAADPPGLEVATESPPHNAGSAKSTKPPPVAKPPPDTSPVMLEFPVIGEHGSSWPLRTTQVDRWRTLYPTLDVLADLRRALAWIEADPQRRTTPKGTLKRLVNWLNRSAESPRARGSPPVITGSLKTAGNKAAMDEVLRRRGHGVD